eukprot:TRINITY_DN21508_c0_g1_i1.p1 TRINITY_DN21508_c0_g1~~TRINITY_DN21508_c0_g1_i1.p1  ORF type:complete len:136 (-),score=31.64 TRINITY_DN21508_c0_g1_i1:33-383(-)
MCIRDRYMGMATIERVNTEIPIDEEVTQEIQAYELKQPAKPILKKTRHLPHYQSFTLKENISTAAKFSNRLSLIENRKRRIYFKDKPEVHSVENWKKYNIDPVSYTHLTLPTIYSV